MNEQVSIQVARHDEQINAIREEWRSGIDRLERALKEHAHEDAAAHAKTDALAMKVEIQAALSRWRWGLVTVSAAAGSGIIMLLHDLGVRLSH